MLRNPIDRLWALLLAATLVTFWLGESGWARSAGGLSVLLMFGLSYYKGARVILDFMELREAPALWRRIMLGWLAAVIGLILLAWWIGRWRGIA